MINQLEAISQKFLTENQIDADTYKALKSSIFPGAKDESISMALAYCRAAKLDIMQKPIHIVPHSIKNAKGQYEMRDTIMPGIVFFRIQASRSGDFAGIDEPEYGPTIKEKMGTLEVTYPEWCKITVKKVVKGIVCTFTAKEFWRENYATKSRNEATPNTMWFKRAYGQLAKCAEAQALRKAFPELLGGLYVAEEMEGKTSIEGVHQVKPTNLDKCISADQIGFLRQRFEETDTEELAVCNHLKIGCIDEMKARDFLMVTRQLDKKIEKKRQADELEINKIVEDYTNPNDVLDVLDQ